MSLPIYPDRQTTTAQYRQWLMGVAGDALRELILQNGKKFWGVQKEQRRAQNTALRHSWHNIDQYTATSIHQN